MIRDANEPPPFISLAPRALSPLVLSCEHATARLPFSGGIGRPQRELLRTHRGWDIGAWALTRELARSLRAPAIGGRWSRLWIDLNRRIDDPTLLCDRAGTVGLPWNERLTPDDVERRILRYHAPYHEALDRLILRHLVRGVRPLLLAVHSFTHEYEGRRRVFDAGVLYEHHRGVAQRLGRNLREAGLSVRYNQPYSGMAGMMYAADRHGTHHRLACLELEFNQALFLNPTAAARLGRIVARALRPILEENDRA